MDISPTGTPEMMKIIQGKLSKEEKREKSAPSGNVKRGFSKKLVEQEAPSSEAVLT
jgi:hypothetical protein